MVERVFVSFKMEVVLQVPLSLYKPKDEYVWYLVGQEDIQ